MRLKGLRVGRRPPSLGARLLLASLLLVLIVLPLAGLALDRNFRLSVTEAFDDRLESLHNALLAGVETDPLNGEVVFQGSLGDPRFERPYSGWYWQIDSADGVITSRSLWDRTLPEPSQGDATELRVYAAEGPRGRPLRIIERSLQLAGERMPVRVSLAVTTEEMQAEIARFDRLLALFLIVFGVVLLVGLALQIRWGLAPLRRLSTSLEAVRSGELSRLENQHLPAELDALARAINGVLARDRQLIERGRAAAGNLAHALKTPLSVLRTHAERFPEDHGAPLNAELARIDNAVRHHLARASAAGGGGLERRVDIGEAVAPVVSALARLAERRGLVFERRINPRARGRIDPQDLQELTGNLLENALAWARSRVTFEVEISGEGVRLLIEDDGPGMSDDQCREALGRGVRLDTAEAGSGLGLAIVDDLVALYGGRFVLSRARAGGLAAEVWLPASPVAAAPSPAEAG